MSSDFTYRPPGARTLLGRLLDALPARARWREPGDPRERAVAGSGRVVLAPPQPMDYHAWSELRRQSREFLAPWEPIWPNDALSRSGYLRRTTRQCEDWNADRGYNLLIWRLDDGALLGGLALTNIRRGVAQAGMLGYWIGQPFAGQGYMTEALGAVTDMAFGELALNRLEAATLPENEPSRRLLVRLGFSEEGMARQYLKIAGQWHDHVLYGLLRSDWRGEAGPGDGGVPVNTPDMI